MKIILTILSVLTVLLLMPSCKKKELTFTLKGTVSDQTFNVPLAGAKVSLEEILEIGNSNDEIIHETVVASDGTYELEFTRRKATKYILRIEKENYFTIYKEISFSAFSTEEALVVVSSTTAKSWVKLVFINEAPADSLDVFRFQRTKGKADCDECCPGTEQSIYGLDTREFLCANDGNTLYEYQYFQTAPAEIGFKEILTPAFDTVEIIKYW